jgi:hypothetical protein
VGIIVATIALAAVEDDVATGVLDGLEAQENRNKMRQKDSKVLKKISPLLLNYLSE